MFRVLRQRRSEHARDNVAIFPNWRGVPDSGTGELTGLTGKMDIIIEGGKHSYAFEYTLPEKS